MSIVTTSHTETTMNQQTAATRKPAITSIAGPGRRRTHKVRLVAGIAINLGGAGLLLSDPTHLLPSLG